MFTWKKTDEALETEIAAVLFSFRQMDRSSDEYARTVDQLTKLYAMKNVNPNRLSKDTLAIVAGNFAGVLAIVIAENHSVISAKALSFISKVR